MKGRDSRSEVTSGYAVVVHHDVSELDKSSLLCCFGKDVGKHEVCWDQNGSKDEHQHGALKEQDGTLVVPGAYGRALLLYHVYHSFVVAADDHRANHTAMVILQELSGFRR